VNVAAFQLEITDIRQRTTAIAQSAPVKLGRFSRLSSQSEWASNPVAGLPVLVYLPEERAGIPKLFEPF
jgi:hypothetical protein